MKALLSISLFCLSTILLTACVVIAWPTNAQQKALADTSSNSRLSILQNNITQYIITRNNIEAKLLANYLLTTLNNSASILEVLSTSHPAIRSLQFVNSINPDFHGVPKNVDLAKRSVADTILSKYKYFGRIFFLLSNGDVYLIEPFSDQQNLTVNNLNFRDYYKGALATHNIYLGGESISLTSHHKTAAIAVPIYSPSGKLSEIWGGALELSVFDKSLVS